MLTGEKEMVGGRRLLENGKIKKGQQARYQKHEDGNDVVVVVDKIIP